MNTILPLILVAMWSENIVLCGAKGLPPLVVGTGSPVAAARLGGVITALLAVGAMVSWPIYHYVLVPNGLEPLALLVSTALVALLHLAVAKTCGQGLDMGKYLPLAAANSVVLAVLLSAPTMTAATWRPNLVAALATGGGFTVVAVLVAGLRGQLALAPILPALRGTPTLFLTLALLALAFGGLTGLA